MPGNSSSTFGYLIPVVAAIFVGATVFSLAGRLYQSEIVYRVTHMSEGDLGIAGDPKVDD